MMSITEILEKIKHAVFGRDVRQAIHDGIKQTYDDATKEGNANMEVSMARGRFGSLNSRLNSIDRVKADQTFVDAQLASIVSGAPKGTYATLQALKDAYPNGEEGVFLVLADGNWYYWNEKDHVWISGGQYQAKDISDGSVTMPKLEVGLRQDLQDLFNSFVRQGDFVPIELFDRRKVKQGGVSHSGTSDSLLRTHIEIEVKPNTDYYVTIPDSDYLRLRNITSWEGSRFIEWNVFDNVLRGHKFTTSTDTNKVIISFCRDNPEKNLSIADTITELVSIFELRMINKNFIVGINQGGITFGGKFTDNPNRTRSTLISVPPLSICEVKVETDSGISIRNLYGYRDGRFIDTLLNDNDNRTNSIFTIPDTINQVAVSFSKTYSPDSYLSIETTLKAKPKMEVSYK